MTVRNSSRIVRLLDLGSVSQFGGQSPKSPKSRGKNLRHDQTNLGTSVTVPNSSWLRPFLSRCLITITRASTLLSEDLAQV